MTTLDANLKKLLDYYKVIDETAGAGLRLTGRGYFSPSSLNDIYSAFCRILHSLDASRFFLDAGSGDGRIIALAALMGFNSVGIEYDKGLANESRMHISNLKDREIIPATVTIQEGDFTYDDVYIRAGIPFSQIGTVYTFLSNSIGIVEMIERNSSGNTRLLLLAASDPLLYPWMSLERMIQIKSQNSPYLFVYSTRS